MGKYGLKIKNFEAAVLYEYNLGLRTSMSMTDAMLSNSLLLDFLEKNGLEDYKGKSTRDVICIKFSFGCNDFKTNMNRLEEQIDKGSCENIEYLEELKEKLKANKERYSKITAQELRTKFYTEGVDVTWTDKKKTTTIHYKMLYRSTGKAKEGSCMFINERLYDKAIRWMRMGIELPEHNAPIVEIGAYASLVGSGIVNRIKIDPKNILVLKDVDSYTKTSVISIETDENKHSFAKKIEKYPLKNTMFDGQALIDSSIFPEWGEGYILLRHHFFKAAAFNSEIQLFMKDYFGDEYDTAEVTDMFGRKMKAKDVLLITTDNALKYLKFDVSFEYWSDWVRENGCLFGIVKTAHPSKLGELQRMSYQMVNALDMRKMDSVIKTSLEYIDRLKRDDDFFLDYLRKNANFANDFEVLVALVENDRDFMDSDYFRERRNYVLKNYAMNFKNGRLLQNADNLVIVGSPYAMLLHSVGDDPLSDPTFGVEEVAIQCWTARFDDGEYLAEFRSPFNSLNNLGCLHNKKCKLLERYFNIGKQCIAVNMNGTDFQSRNNGSDQDFSEMGQF